MFYRIFFSFYIINIMEHDDRILKKHEECDGVLDIDNDELDIFFSSTDDDELLGFDNRRRTSFSPISSNTSISSYSPTTFRSNSISPPYSVPRRSPSSYTFVSDERKKNMDRRRKKRMERQRKFIQTQRINNATKKIQSAYRKHLSKKNKGNDCCAMMGGKKNEKDCGCGIMGGKRKTKRRWSRKYKKSINCRNPKGFSQKQYCKYGRKKSKRSKKMRGGGWRKVDYVDNLKDYRYKGLLTYGEEGSARNLINNTKSLEECKKKGLPSSIYGFTPCHDVYNYYGKELTDRHGNQMVIEIDGKLKKNPAVV